MTDFKLDRSAFRMGSHKMPGVKNWKSKTIRERLEVANYLNSVAYNYPLESPPTLDRTAFKIRKR